MQVVEDGAGDDDAARCGEALEPGGDVDTIAEQVAALHDHVAEIDPDPQRQCGVRPFLDRDRAADRIHHARKLGEQSVTHQLDETSVVLRQCGLDDLRSQGCETAERDALVPLHEC